MTNFFMVSTKSVTLAASAFGLIGMSALINAEPAQALILNGDFENNLSGWETLGYVSTTSSGMAKLTAGNAKVSSVENFLGLASGSIGGIGHKPTVGAAIKQTFYAKAGDTVTFDWLFNAKDYLPYNDFAFTSLSSEIAGLASVSSVGNYGNSGSQSFSWDISTSGYYTLGFGVFNSKDSVNDSKLYLDNIVHAGDVDKVPTPAAVLPVLSGLLAAARRKKNGEAIAEEA